jgi:hypothetical protein
MAMRRVLLLLGLLFLSWIPCGAQTTTAYGLTFPNAHPRLFWTASRIATAQAWVTSSGYAGMTTNDRAPYDDYDQWFTCRIMNNATACANIISEVMALSPSTPNGTGGGDNVMRVYGEIAALTRDGLAPGCGVAQCLTAGQVATFDANWHTWITNQDDPSQIYGNICYQANNYFAGEFRLAFSFGIATYLDEPTYPDVHLKYAIQNRWNNYTDYVSPSGSGCNGARGYGFPSNESASEYSRYGMYYYTMSLASSALFGRDLGTETLAFKANVLGLIYNTMPTANTQGRNTLDLFTTGDDEQWPLGGNASFPPSHNLQATGPCVNGANACRQDYGDFMQAAATEYSSINIGKYARQWINTNKPPIGPIFLSVDPGGSALALSNLPLAYYASGPRWLWVRTDWGASATSIFWQLGAASAGGSGHWHEDAGSFQAFRKGVNIVRETMGYSETVAGYNSTGLIGIENGLPHNVPLVGGIANHTVYSCSDGYGNVTRLETQPGYTFAAVDLTLFYQNNVCDSGNPARQNPHVVSLVREFYFIPGINVQVIFDRFQTDAAGTSTTFDVHCETNPTLTATTIPCIDGGQEALYTALIPASPTMVKVAENANSANINAAEWQYRIESNNSNPGNVVSYDLYPAQFCDSGACNLTPSVVDSSPGTPSTGTFTVTLDANDSIVINKGTSSSGGTIKTAGTTRALRADVQPMTVTDSGPVWAGAVTQTTPSQVGPGVTLSPGVTCCD